MKIEKYKNRKLFLLVVAFSCFIFNFQIKAQSALGQLQTLAGQSVDTQIPTPNCVCAYCGYPCGSGHSSSCPYYSGEVQESTQATDKNLTYRIEKSNVYNEKGNVFFRNGDYEKALNAYKIARFYNPFDEVVKQNYAAAKKAVDAKKKEKHIVPKPPKPKPTPVSPNVVDLTHTQNPTPTIIGGYTTQQTVTPSVVPPLPSEVKQYGQMYAAQSKLFNNLIDHNIIDSDNPYIKVTEGIMNDPSVLVYNEDFQKEEEKKHPTIEYYRKIGVAAAGFMPTGVNYGFIVANNLLFKNISVYTDIYNGTENREIHEAQVFTIVNALKQSEWDVANAAYGDALQKIGIKTASLTIPKASEGIAVAINNSSSAIAPNLGSAVGNKIMTTGKNVSELVLSETAEKVGQVVSFDKDYLEATDEYNKSFEQQK